jgi:hypothetical protein
MTPEQIAAIRARLAHSISPSIGRLIGLDPMALQQVAYGWRSLSDPDWATLALALGIQVPAFTMSTSCCG